MNTAKIYKITITKAYMMSEQGEGYSLRPWGNNTDYYEGYDDGGKYYELPEGYEVAECVTGDLQIYDTSNQYCTITKKFNSPCLNNTVMLKLAKEEA